MLVKEGWNDFANKKYVSKNDMDPESMSFLCELLSDSIDVYKYHYLQGTVSRISELGPHHPYPDLLDR